MTELEKFEKHVMAKCRDMVFDDYHKVKQSDRQDFSSIGDQELKNIQIEFPAYRQVCIPLNNLGQVKRNKKN